VNVDVDDDREIRSFLLTYEDCVAFLHSNTYTFHEEERQDSGQVNTHTSTLLTDQDHPLSFFPDNTHHTPRNLSPPNESSSTTSSSDSSDITITSPNFNTQFKMSSEDFPVQDPLADSLSTEAQERTLSSAEENMTTKGK
jgi:hypothetical protein